MWDQVKYLCSKINEDEWSGVLYYNINGSIKDVDNLSIELLDIFPMDKGNATFTSYDFGGPVVEHMMKNEELSEAKIGHIHSHNNMSVFFSGTDWSELEENAPNHNFYLSLIVNNKGDTCAKLCFIASADTEEAEITFKAKDENGEVYELYAESIKVDKEKLVVFDCVIDKPVQELLITEDFVSRTDLIIKEAASRPKHNFKKTPNTVGFKNKKNSTEPSFAKAWELEQEAKKNVVYKGFLDTSSKHFDRVVADFLMFLLNGGAPFDPRKYSFPEDLLDDTPLCDKTSGEIASYILDIYDTSFTKFFAGYTNNKSISLYGDVLEGLILTIEHEINTATHQSKGILSMMEPLKSTFMATLELHNNDITI